MFLIITVYNHDFFKGKKPWNYYPSYWTSRSGMYITTHNHGGSKSTSLKVDLNLSTNLLVIHNRGEVYQRLIPGAKYTFSKSWEFLSENQCEIFSQIIEDVKSDFEVVSTRKVRNGTTLKDLRSTLHLWDSKSIFMWFKRSPEI